jgi:uncharacterized protein (TIGR00255 family)
MILSMTGFSSSTIALPSIGQQVDTPNDTSLIQITMTLKTLNSRFFEANCKLPYALTGLETELIKLFKAELIRGNIYFTMHMANPYALTASLAPALPTIAGYVEGVSQIQKQFKITGELTINALLALPHVFENQEQIISEELSQKILHEAQKLVRQLTQVRLQEGRALETDLTDRISTIKRNLQDLEPRAHEVMEQRKAQLFQNLNTLLTGQKQEMTAEAQNAFLYNQLDRIDIHEEIVRFKSHLESLCTIIASSEREKGKKLDFTLQELFREINTLTSKGSDATLSSYAINIKVELEKMREQTQNIV